MRCLSLLAYFLLFTLVKVANAGQPIPVVVQSVVDGDTINIVGEKNRIRLASIDAPELSHGYGRPGQPFGQFAKSALEVRLRAGEVSLDCVDVDRYGRSICVVFQAGFNVNQWMVEQGLAWANTAQVRYLRSREYLALQDRAKAAQKGLWAEPNPVEPWLWRRQK
jgi:endonuclease YncB( thermonuclease family)